MKNVSGPKNGSGGRAPSGNSNMGGGRSGGSRPMPRVGGHTSNAGRSSGVGGGPYGGKGGC
jgi:hypothetical protein